MKKILILCALVFISVALSAEVRFSDLDVSEAELLLFKATTDSPVYGSFETLLLGDLRQSTLRQLTYFPEQVLYLRETGQLQIQNRFGVFRTDNELKRIGPVSNFPAFVNGRGIQTGKINPAHASTDGKWLLYQRPTSPGYADLVLYDASKDKEHSIASDVTYSLKGPEAAWAPDGRFFIYSKDNTLYYYSIDQLVENRVFSEEFRAIGAGRIKNVRWNDQNNLYYITGSRVYQIFSAELFTHSIYSNLLEIGTIVGKIPFQFDPNFDNFWISPDGRNLLLDKGGRNIFIYVLSLEDFLTTGDSVSLPYLFLPRNTRVKKVLWPGTRNVTLLTCGISEGVVSSSIYRLQKEENSENRYFFKTDDTGIRDIVLSGDKQKVAMVMNDKVLIRDYQTWKELSSLPFDTPYHCIWKDDSSIIVAGAYTTELISISEKKSTFLYYSQPGEFGFAKSSRNISMKLGEETKEFILTDNRWVDVESFDPGTPRVYSPSNRVYLELASMGSYHNIVMVRDKVGYGTKPLFEGPEKQYEPFPIEDEPVSFFNFRHGSRIRRREVSLVFNAIDTVEGLTDILNTLAEYGLRSTFFVNGEFIRRHPGAVKEIAEAGHEVGSLFYVYFNMTDSAFEMDPEFIKRGLARNEDDYFKATGRELSLLWHTPFYFVNSDIIETAGEMNYAYVGRDVDSLDWVTREQASRSSGVYLGSPDLVERIIRRKKPGSIVSVQIGKREGSRDDYLFHNLDILIDGLISLGFSIVPVSTLIEHAK